MEMLYAVLVASCILLFLYIKFPYFLHDCRYIMKILAIRSRRTGFNKKTYTILECFLDCAKRLPHKPFIIFEDEIYTYVQADKMSNKAARALKAHASLHERDTVALFVGNEPSFVWLWLGLLKLGCAISLINTNIRGKSFVHCISCCEPKALITDAERRQAVCEVLEELRSREVSVFILGGDGGPEGLQSLSDKMEASSDAPVCHALRAGITMSSPALYIFTSGTTGLPKSSLYHYERIWRGAFFLDLNGVTAEDVIYITLPLYHAAGLVIGLSGAVERGITVVLKKKFSVSQFWNDCRKHNVTVIQYIGETMRYLCNTPKRDNDHQHKVRMAIGNGIRADVWQEFQQRFGNVDIKEFYAASDGNISFQNYTGKVGAVGRLTALFRKLVPHAIIQYDTEQEKPVRDSRGRCVPVSKGETGLLVSKITKVAPLVGYTGNPEQTEKKILCDVFQNGDAYLNSGDLLKIDHNNFIYFQDRVGDTFRWKGENVSTTEVSDVVMMLDFIEDANVYGVAVPGHEGQTGMAAVTLKENREFDCKETFIHVTKYLPFYARPRFIRILSNMELTGTFKHVKMTLKKQAYDLACIAQPVFVLQESRQSYVLLKHDYYRSIVAGGVCF